MRTVRLGFFAIALLPTLLMAQRRGGGPQRPPEPHLKAGDFEHLNPARVAIDRQKDLALEPARAQQLDSIAKAFDVEANGFAHVLDTLQKAMRLPTKVAEYLGRGSGSDPRPTPKSPKDSADRARKDSVEQVKMDRDIERVMLARREFSAMLLKIRAIYDGYMASTMAVLNDEQRGKLSPWIQAASEELTRRLHWVNQTG